MKQFLLSSLLVLFASASSWSQVRFSLSCGETTYDEMDTPMSKVYLTVNDLRHEVGECMSCNEIDQEDFEVFEIPEQCKTAVGGWYAGGGDYFYAVKSATKEEIEVFFGWQEDGQEDDSFHWELHRTVKIKK